MGVVTGTFSGTGSSAPIVGKSVAFHLTFAGAATVNIQWQVDGTNWLTMDSFQASEKGFVDSEGIPIRLNCSAYTDGVDYVLRTL